MESQCMSGSNDRVKINPEVKHEDGKPLLGGDASRFSSASSSSSYSLEFDSGRKDLLDNSSAKSGRDKHLSSEPESISSPDVSDQTPNWSMISASPRAGNSFISSPELSHWNTNSTSEMKSPPTQTMGRPAGYDPNRIPSSIFSSKPTTPTDWSVNSNESLFSIHMGNNSFSRDHAILVGKSGELSRTEEWANSLPSPHYVHEAKSNELNSFPSPLPPVIEGHEENSVKVGMSSRVEKEDFNNSPRMSSNAKEKVAPAGEVHLSATSSNVGDSKGSPCAEPTRNSSGALLTSSSPPRLSDESGNSGKSFAFPV